MDEDEVKAIRDWMHSGGCLFATGWTSLVNKSGKLQKDFMLADVLGVSLKQPSWRAWDHYVAPTSAGKTYFSPFSVKYPAYARTIGIHIEARQGAEVLATTTLPWPTSDPTRFSSIHSNPPWEATNRPEVVLNKHGKGRAIYCSSPLETIEVLDEAFVRLVRSLYDTFTFALDAPACVEATLFHQPARHRYLLTLINFQKDLPNLPIDSILVRLRLPKGKVKAINQLPDAGSLAFRETDGDVSFRVGRLQTMGMLEIQVG
jgi:hypothetical protein